VGPLLVDTANAGAYVFGRTRQDRYVAADGRLRLRQRRLPQDEWEVLITEHHPGFIDWDTYQTNQDRIGANIRPERHQPGTGAVREGAALLQGLATCGTCGRKLAVLSFPRLPGDFQTRFDLSSRGRKSSWLPPGSTRTSCGNGRCVCTGSPIPGR
jgi:hypothetical protein